MAGTPSGLLGNIAATRPILLSVVLALGMTSLCVIGVRQSDAANAQLIAGLMVNAIAAIAAPFIVAALTPAKPSLRFITICVIMIAGGGSIALLKSAAAPVGGLTPSVAIVATALGLYLFLQIFAAFFGDIVRLSVIAPLATLLGFAGAAGYLAFDNLLLTQTAPPMTAILLVIGFVIGTGVAADFVHIFAKGAEKRQAAAAAGYLALAPTSFSVLTAGAYFAVFSFKSNYGAIDWPYFQGGVIGAVLTAVAALIASAGSLSLSGFGAHLAEAEHHRERWFIKLWRPVRSLFPASSSLAATAIAGVLTVIAAFETGIAAPASLLGFLGVTWIAAAVAFVSLRVSLLIVAMLFLSALLSQYAFAVMGFSLPGLEERLTAITLTALALGQLAVSWRNAGDTWRNERDVAQNAMTDGLRRYLLTVGVGVATLSVVAQSFGWAGGNKTALFFITTSAFALLILPAMMIALSAKMRRY